MNENPNCQLCTLHTKARTVCMPGVGNVMSNLHIYLDQPSYRDDMNGRAASDDAGDLLKYMLARMGIHHSRVYIDYVLKCRAGKMLPTKKKERAEVLRACSVYRLATLQTFFPNVVLTVGGLSAEVFMDAEVGKLEGAVWICQEPEHNVKRIWCTYSINYLREKPAESSRIYGALWMAAHEAGLDPKETNVPPFDWDSFRSNK